MNWMSAKPKSFFKLKGTTIVEKKEPSLIIDPNPLNEEKYELKLYLRLTVEENSKKEKAQENRNSSDVSQD